MSQKGRKGSYINGLLKASKSFIQYCYDEGYGCGLSRPHVFCPAHKTLLILTTDA